MQQGLPFEFHQERRVYFQGQEERFYRGGVGVRFISVENGEQRLLGGAMWCRVVVEFCRR